MLRADLEKVFIEHCIGCKTHQWCTNHDEDKYIHYFTMCKNIITRTCSRVTVSQNEVPLGFQDKFVSDPNISHFGRYHFPRIGAFEVYFRGKVIFSKIESMKWPHPGKVAEKIKEIQEAPPQKNLKKKVVKAKRIKSAMPIKKKKSKKGRKKLLRTRNKDKIMSPKSEDIQKKPVSRDQQLTGVRSYKQAELPNFSADISQNSDSEQVVSKKAFNNPQPRQEKNYAKENLPNSFSPINAPANKAKELNFFVDRPKDQIQVLDKLKDPMPEQKQPTPVVKQENFPVTKSPTPMTKVVKSPSSDLQIKPTTTENIKNKNPYDTSSESSSNDYGYSSRDSQQEHIDYLELMKKFPDNFKQDPEIEKFIQRNIEAEAKSKENGKEKNPKKEKSSSDYSKDYEDERFEKNKKFVKKSDDEEDYSDDDYEDDKKGDKESDDEEYSDEDYEADSGRGSKSSSSNNKKVSKGSSKKDDYEDSDFEEEQAHPLRPVDKSYNVKLPLGEESKKKITYQNMGDSNGTFLIESSHPDYMSVKEPDLHIEKGKKGKIQLRFAPMMNADEKKYYLYVDRNGQPWECIEIVAEYED
ncbi:hypothetical protein SteCoe_17628 [Stentor coeruleus]|uniref:NPHP4 Ig-like domain-containing protein n=1 Tax=Stentor coeruleus TaxID=5963 RepID=A0A1R2BYJ0_9CILI|nr:hypothetical protein SteCoe_17628 [Stentor coeruleus]